MTRVAFRPGMQALVRILFITAVASSLLANTGFAQPTNHLTGLQWRPADGLRIEGKGWSDTKSFYDRLPATAENTVRKNVWNLGRDSSGICIRFLTDATNIAARWTVRKDALGMPHMPPSGVSGLDLYLKEKGEWRWVGNARPFTKSDEKYLVKSMKPGRREYALYLPLYNGIEELSIGVDESAALETAPARIAKPVVFYGTSILQGGCASRPGMAYPAILGRRLDWPTINLGFSGNAHCEPEVARLLAELDPAVYVLDPLPNMTAQMVAERLERFVQIIRKARPNTPIIFVEHVDYTDGEFVPSRKERVAGDNAKLKETYERLLKSGQKKLFYVPNAKLFGADGEATVDGTHPTDLGFLRMADAIEPTLRKALKAK